MSKLDNEKLSLVRNFTLEQLIRAIELLKIEEREIFNRWLRSDRDANGPGR